MSEYEKLQKLIDGADELIKKKVTAEDPEFGGWEFRVKKYINEKFGENSFEMDEFKKISFTLGWFVLETPHSDFVDACREGLKMAKEILKVYIEDLGDKQFNTLSIDSKNIKKNDYNRIFIVHGHDVALKEKVARIIEKQKIEAIILSEQTNKGKTIIEKFEEYADVPCAICLFTKDDIAINKNNQKELLRARQNVVFETGYFMGKIGRDRVIILSDSEIEMPSDLSGVLYTNKDNWENKVLKELKEMGYSIDMNI